MVVAVAVMVVSKVAVEVVAMVVIVVVVVVTTPLSRDLGCVLTHTCLALHSGVLSFPSALVF
jgi:hypothetical protein